MRSKLGYLLAGLTVVVVASDMAAAAPRHRHETMRAPQAKTDKPTGFYANEIDGGVSGNLPFNNQIRKMKDPLNANGAGR